MEQLEGEGQVTLEQTEEPDTGDDDAIVGNDTDDDDFNPDHIDVDHIDAEALDSIPNQQIRRIMDRNFIEYASYVIKDRAIPDVDDGLKPVQRRVLWTLFSMENGTYHKVANVVGETMKYHPHGDSSIYGALVTIANKELFIDKQGSFGNIILGTPAAAGRYIECKLSKLAKDVLFNPDLTELVDSYDGRNQEPVCLPSKIPNLLLMGTEGVAVGTKTLIFPYNFNEVLQAQISILKGESFTLYPDFPHGGIIDVSDYQDGLGKIVMRSHIDIDGHNLIIRDIPAATDTSKLVDSIEKQVKKNKIKISTVHDYSAENVEIQLVLQRGYAPERALAALYSYTNCQMTITSYPMVICDNVPQRMSITDILMCNTAKLVQYLTWELQILSAKCLDKILSRTLAQIFIEERIYKDIETCKDKDTMFSIIRDALEKFRNEWQPIVEQLSAAIDASPHIMPMPKEEVQRLKQLKDGIIPDIEIERLVEIPIRRIAAFEIDKNRKEILGFQKGLADAQKKLKNITKYTIGYLQKLIAEYGSLFPRRTEISLEKFEKIDKQRIAIANIRVGWDRKNCYIGTKIKSDDYVQCNEVDHLLCIERSGDYKIIPIPEKIFIDRLYEFRKYDKNTDFGVVYTEKKTGKVYWKRTSIKSFISEKEYRIIPDDCKLELITPRPNAVYEIKIDTPIRAKQIMEINLMDAPMRTPKAGGILLSQRKLVKITFKRYLDEIDMQPTEPDLPGLPAKQDAGEGVDSPDTETTDVRDTAPAEDVKATPTIKPDVRTDAKPEAKNPEISKKEQVATPIAQQPEQSAGKTEATQANNDREEDSWNIQPDLGL